MFKQAFCAVSKFQISPWIVALHPLPNLREEIKDLENSIVDVFFFFFLIIQDNVLEIRSMNEHLTLRHQKN